MQNLNFSFNLVDIFLSFLIYFKQVYQRTQFCIIIKLSTAKNEHLFRLIKIYQYLIFSILDFCLYWISFAFRILSFFEEIIYDFELPICFQKLETHKLNNRPIANLSSNNFDLQIISHNLLYLIKDLYFNIW